LFFNLTKHQFYPHQYLWHTIEHVIVILHARISSAIAASGEEIGQFGKVIPFAIDVKELFILLRI
jgi:hypothetical protein